VNGRVVVHVVVSISDDETPYRPVGGLELGFFRPSGDSAVVVTDRTGSATILLTPGQYRLASLEPTQWKGVRYSWSMPVRVRPGMAEVELRSDQAMVRRVTQVAAVSDGETSGSRDIPRGFSGDRSHSSGFFIGFGFEGQGLTTTNSDLVDSGTGGALILGYGFNQRWALFGDVSGATMNAADGSGTYSLGHFDVGARVHFRTGPNVVVPFLQFGLTGRVISYTANGSDFTGTGGGVSFGGGLNAHFTPNVALSGLLTYSAGNFDNFQVDNLSIGGYSVDAMTARLHLGIIWFPR